MTISPSFPGIYIQELASNSHAIIPTPTSIAAFVGYSHPYQTGAFGVAQQLFSFTDYDTYFGGLFSSGLTDASLPRAVYQFFLNGGSTAWVVGLQPGLFDKSGTLLTRLGPNGVSPTYFVQTDSPSDGLLFSALEPIDAVPMQITVTNIRTSNTMFDVIVTYGTQVETYRGITLPVGTTPKPTDPNVMINSVSKLVRVTPGQTGTGSYGASISGPPASSVKWTDVTANAATYSTGYSADDFLGNASTPGIFEPNSTLDNVEIFNLLLVPGIADNAVVSAGALVRRAQTRFRDSRPAAAIARRRRATSGRDPAATAANRKLDDRSRRRHIRAAREPERRALFPLSGLRRSGHRQPHPDGAVRLRRRRLRFDRCEPRRVESAGGTRDHLLNTLGPVDVRRDERSAAGRARISNRSTACAAFSGVGTVVWGSRTLVAANPAYQQWMYVPVRRMTLFIEQTLLANLRWVVFEPNDEPLWVAITASIDGIHAVAVPPGRACRARRRARPSR